jgi:hypothetical protein
MAGTSTNSASTFTTAATGQGMHLNGITMVDTHTAYVVGADLLIRRFDPSAAANDQVADWSLGSADWSSGFFGVCLQALGGSALPDWTTDTGGTAGVCEQSNTDGWRAVPASMTTIAHTSGIGSGYADLVWGMQASGTQNPARYEATVVFQAMAPGLP